MLCKCCAMGVAGIPQRAGTLKPLAKRSCNASASGHAQICLPTSFFCYLDGNPAWAWRAARYLDNTYIQSEDVKRMRDDHGDADRTWHAVTFPIFPLRYLFRHLDGAGGVVAAPAQLGIGVMAALRRQIWHRDMGDMGDIQSQAENPKHLPYISLHILFRTLEPDV